jgi:hypothetical protein
MFDIFYIGQKPNLFPHERPVDNIEQAQTLTRTRFCWVINYLLDYTNFDFLWEPVPWQSEYTHAWPTQWDQFYGAYLIPKHGEIKYHYHTDVIPTRQFPDNYKILANADFDQSWVPHPWDPPYIYVFGNQWHPAEKMPSVEYHAPGATERKYMSWPRATLRPDPTHWQVPNSIDATTVEYSWVPDPRAPPYIYQFATQHQKTGGPVYTVPGATETKYLAELKIRTVGKATAIYEIDHLDGTAGQIPNTTRRVRYFDNYRDTLVRIAKSIGTEHEYAWVCSSICDYTDFDFSWHPEQWQSTMLHVFASDGEKFGDTFFMHVPTFAEYAEKKALLEWYDVNFVGTSVCRKPMPVIKHNFDSQPDAVKSLTWNGPLALFTTTDYVHSNLATVPLWRTETKTIIPLDPGANSVIVPRPAVPYIKTQLYDYPYIDREHMILKAPVLDVVFISNGEEHAEFNFEQLQWNLVMSDKGNCLHRVSNINGRVAAYHAAANLSTTPWFFAVFAKLNVDVNFDFSWQPDRMQEPKHYIFHAGNPVNGLVYGHQAMIAYNKSMVLENTGKGLDFTLDQPHEVVPIISGTANYTESPWMAWRTAFREALKLRASLPDVENEYRLRVWLREDSGTIANGHWSHKGAQDAMEYYDLVNGDPAELQKSYEWDWLASYAFMKRNLTPDL